jgi:hypothetical protein
VVILHFEISLFWIILAISLDDILDFRNHLYEIFRLHIFLSFFDWVKQLDFLVDLISKFNQLCWVLINICLDLVLFYLNYWCTMTGMLEKGALHAWQSEVLRAEAFNLNIWMIIAVDFQTWCGFLSLFNGFSELLTQHNFLITLRTIQLSALRLHQLKDALDAELISAWYNNELKFVLCVVLAAAGTHNSCFHLN